MSGNRLVALVYPKAVTGWQAQPWCDLPLELLAVATPLVRAGYEVRIIDQRMASDWRDQLRSTLSRRPICVGVTSTTGPQLRHALEISELVKRDASIPVVWGGVHASLLPEQTLAEPDIDFVVQGEGEETFLELVQPLDRGDSVSNIPGLWYKEQGQPRHTRSRPFIDLNEQAPLAYDLVDVRQYGRTVFGVKRLSFSTSRGCTFPCAYCYNTVFHRRRWRALKAEVAVSQIKDFVQRYSVRGLFLTDANFFLDLDRARGILEGVLREDLGIVFSRLHIRFDTLIKMDDEDFRLIETAGCKCLAVGIESGSERIQKLLRKPINTSHLLALNRKLSRFSIVPLYFFMIGFPTETVEDLKKTVSLSMKLLEENPRATISVNIYTPYPGTELFHLAVAKGLKPPQRVKEWAPFNYRSIAANGEWLSAGTRQTVEMLDFCSFFVSRVGFARSFKKTNSLVALLAGLYAPIARRRIRSLFYRFPIEIKLAKCLGLYARQS